MGPTRPLQGIIVLDLTRFLPGAVATLQLASFGAEVIKIACGIGCSETFTASSWLFCRSSRAELLQIDPCADLGKRTFTNSLPPRTFSSRASVQTL